MRTTHATATEVEEMAVTMAPDPNLQMFVEYKQLDREIKNLSARKDALKEDIKTAMKDGETFGNETEYLELQAGETRTFDYKKAILAGVMTEEQAQPFIKSSGVYAKLVFKKREASPVPPSDPTEAEAMRQRLENAGRGLLG